MKLHIGVDIDGVMFDYVENITNWIRSKYLDDPAMLDKIDENPASHWHFYRDWGFTDEEFVAFNRMAAEAGHLYRGGIEKDWVPVLTELREMGHAVHLVTARFEGAPGPTWEWVNQHEVPHDSLIFVQKDKSHLGLNVLIDDRIENIRDWVAQPEHWGIIYSQPWNEGADLRSIRSYNAQGVRAAIQYISNAEDAKAIKSITPDETILQEAQRLVHGERGDDYGHPAQDMERTGRIWGAILEMEDPVPAWKVALCMAGVKISREVNAHKRDNLTDLAGYAEVTDMVYEKLPRS